MERFSSNFNYHTWYEHWHRYYSILNLVKDKSVCDIACGEGYGSALLAKHARNVIGIDIDQKTISNAKNKYQLQTNLEFFQKNAIKTNIQENSIDVVVSFETIEHLAEHDELLIEISRILNKDGILIISTPDKDIYSSGNNSHNEYHVKELTFNEFKFLISKHFTFSSYYGQQFRVDSVIESISHQTVEQQSINMFCDPNTKNTLNKNKSDFTYIIAVCSNNKNTSISIANSSFCDVSNQLFNLYEDQVKKLAHADSVNQNLKNKITEQSTIINHLLSRLGL